MIEEFALAPGSPSRPSPDAAVQDVGGYPELRRRVRAAGLLDRSYRYYALLAVSLGIGLLAVVLVVWFLPPVPRYLVAAPAIAIWMVQIGLLGHDAGHHGIFRRTRANRGLGLICFPLLLGMSFDRWVSLHNAHHAHTNEVDTDPDMSHPLLVFTPEQAAARHGLRRWLVRYQAYLLVPLATWAGLTVRVQAWRHVLGGRRVAGVRWEAALLAGACLGWLVLPSLLFGPARWLPLFGLSQMLLGPYMVLIFAPNHKGMPIVRGRRPGFLEQQVLSSRNVRGSPIVDFVFGGLNYQIEHHLFPTMPRNRLPECQRIVRAFCLEVGLPYEEQGVVASYRTLFGQLDAVGRGRLGLGESRAEMMRS